MSTIQQQTLARLRAEAERQMRIENERDEREIDRLRRERSDLADAGDLIVGVMAGVGLSALLVLAVWGLL